MSETTEKEQKAELPEQLSDVLLLLDDEKKKIRIIKGVDKNGEPETVEPSQKNSNQFLKVDKHGDAFSNFFSNFISQIKNPTRFRFFKVPEQLAVKIANFLVQHAENPSEIGEALMKKYEVTQQQKQNQEHQNQNIMDTNHEVKTAQTAEETKTTQQAKPEKDNKSEETTDRYKYKPEDVDWSLLNKLGLDKENLEKMKLLDPLLRGFKTNKLLNISFNLEGVPIRFDARVSLQMNQNNQVVPAFHGIRREPNLDFPFYGHTFSEQDKKNLQTDGNMGRVVDLVNPRTGDVIPSLISIDKLTNEVVALRKEWVKIPDELSNVKLTEQQKQDLSEGKQLHLKDMVSQNGTPFEAKVQFNADKKYVEYLFYMTPKIAAKQIKDNEPKEAPRIFRNKELTEKQYEKFKDGHTLFIRDFKDKEGQKYGGYITYNKKKGITDFSFKDPRKVQDQATPAEENKTQKAVNSDGKTNEATKNIKEPLQQAQTTAKNTKQQEQQQPEKPSKSKGRKM